MIDEKLRTNLKFQQISKTNERLEFEREYRCYVYLTREENRFGYDIDSVYNQHGIDEPETTLSILAGMKLRARFNRGTLRSIWLPKCFGELTTHDFEQSHIKYLLDKYSYKL